MLWRKSWRADPVARQLADRHYNRQSVGAADFMPPGRCLVLRTEAGDAVWGTSWPFAEFTKHAWAGAWACSLFRNESPHLASILIREAVAATRAVMGEPSPLGLVTFIDRKKVRPVMVRGVPTYGRTWLLAGFKIVGETAGGLLALQMEPQGMPEAAFPLGFQRHLWAA